MEPDSPRPGWSTQEPPPFAADDGTAKNVGWTPSPPAPQPGVIPLRPLKVGDILTGAIDYVRRDPGAVIGISAIVGFGAALVQLGLLAVTDPTSVALTADPNTADPEVVLDELAPQLIALVGWAAASSAVIAALQVLGTGMLAHVMGRAVTGHSTTLSRAWQLIRPQILRLLVATIAVSVVVGLAVALPVLPGIVLLVVGATQAGAVGLVFGVPLAIVLGVWAWFSLVLTTPALALEDCNALTALRRSAGLVRGAFWRTLGIVLLGTLVGQAVGSIAAIPFNLFAGSGAQLTTGSVFALAIGGMVTLLVALPFIAGVNTLVYIDRRIRTENLGPALETAAREPR